MLRQTFVSVRHAQAVNPKLRQEEKQARHITTVL
jgi:hypothetical protein